MVVITVALCVTAALPNSRTLHMPPNAISSHCMTFSKLLWLVALGSVQVYLSSIYDELDADQLRKELVLIGVLDIPGNTKKNLACLKNHLA